MKKSLFRLIFNLLIISLSLVKGYSQSQPSAIEKKYKSEILSKNQEMEVAFKLNDMKKIASFYSDSSILIGEKIIVSGREDIDSYWMSLKDIGIKWEIENIKIEACDHIAIQQGISKLAYIFQGQEQLSIVRFTLVWKRVDGDWLIEIDHYSSIQ